jgi:hypothetical protein
VGVRYAARAPGRVPPVNGERLDDALAILAGTHVRARLRIGDDAYRGPIERAHAWRVCFTDPAQTHRIARGRRVLVVIDRVTGRTGGGPPCDFF